MLESAELAVRFASGHRRTDLDDEMLRPALTTLVEIVGEAAKQVSSETRADHPSVPWPAAARMRDRRVHHDFDIDRNVLRVTVTTELPEPIRALPPVDGGS